jgi:TetR/AcrR family transcriptional regulator, copper-responsive repressor
MYNLAQNILHRDEPFMQHGTKRRSRGGRPREFDEDEALEKMQRRLWTTGLSGVSVDGIARSAGLNRPSLAAAFGDKNAIYAQAAARFAEMMDERLGRALDHHDLDVALRRAFDTAIGIYTARGADGCFVICTAPAEALTNPVCRDILVQAIDGMDAVFLRRLAKEAKRPSAEGVDVPMVAAQLGATLQSIALRARAGWKRHRLQRLAASAIAQVMAVYGKSRATRTPAAT